MQNEAMALLSKMWKAISAKRTVWGWFVVLISAVFFVSDRWDSLNSFYEKLKKMGPFLKFVADAAHSPLVQLGVFAAGVIWIGLAAFFSVKRQEKIEGEASQPQTTDPRLPGRNISPTVTKVVDEAVRLIREDDVRFLLYALQKAGVGDLDSEADFFAARDAIIQRNLPDPIKDLSITDCGVTWLELIRFANKREKSLYDKAEVLDCLQDYLTQPISIKPGQTAIEAIDAVIGKCRILERVFASISDPLPYDQPRILVEEARTVLREYAPEFVDKFNSAIRNPQRFANFPTMIPDRTVEELGKWVSDKTRRDGWDVIDAAVRYLAQTRQALFSKLP